MWKSYTKINTHQKDRLFDVNGNKFKLLIIQVGQQEYNVYYPYKFKTPVIDFYYKKIVTIEYEVNGPYKNAVSITDGKVLLIGKYMRKIITNNNTTETMDELDQDNIY